MFRTPERDVHVHLWVAGTDEITRHLEFRDRLRASEADRRAYSELKHRLAEREWDDINDYARGEGRADRGDPGASTGGLTCHPAAGEAALAPARRRARRAEPVPAAVPLRADRVRAARARARSASTRASCASRTAPSRAWSTGCAGTAACAATRGCRSRRRAAPARDVPPERDEIELPPRGKPLRDKIVLRLIAINRALHFVVLGAIAIAIFVFASHRDALREQGVPGASSTCRRARAAAGRRPTGSLHEIERSFSLRVGHDQARRPVFAVYALIEGIEAFGPLVPAALGRVPDLHRHDVAAAAGDLRARASVHAVQDPRVRDQRGRGRVPAARQAPVRSARRRRRRRSASGRPTSGGRRSSAPRPKLSPNLRRSRRGEEEPSCRCVVLHYSWSRSRSRAPSPADAAPPPGLGPNVVVFDPSMPVSEIQATARRDLRRSRSTTRWAPTATRSCSSRAPTAPRRSRCRSRSATTPRSPASARRPRRDDQRQGRGLQPLPRPTAARATASRSSTSGARCPTSRSNVNAAGQDGCRATANFWAVSQAVVDAPGGRSSGGDLSLMDYCTAGPQFASGGFIADSQLPGPSSTGRSSSG